MVQGSDSVLRPLVRGNGLAVAPSAAAVEANGVFAVNLLAAAHHAAARQEHAERAALRIGGVEAALLAHVPVEFKFSGALEQHRGQALALRDEFGDLQHVLESYQFP